MCEVQAARPETLFRFKSFVPEADQKDLLLAFSSWCKLLRKEGNRIAYRTRKRYAKKLENVRSDLDEEKRVTQDLKLELDEAKKSAQSLKKQLEKKSRKNYEMKMLINGMKIEYQAQHRKLQEKEQEINMLLGEVEKLKEVLQGVDFKPDESLDRNQDARAGGARIVKFVKVRKSSSEAATSEGSIISSESNRSGAEKKGKEKVKGMDGKRKNKKKSPKKKKKKTKGKEKMETRDDKTASVVDVLLSPIKKGKFGGDAYVSQATGQLKKVEKKKETRSVRKDEKKGNVKKRSAEHGANSAELARMLRIQIDDKISYNVMEDMDADELEEYAALFENTIEDDDACEMAQLREFDRAMEEDMKEFLKKKRKKKKKEKV